MTDAMQVKEALANEIEEYVSVCKKRNQMACYSLEGDEHQIVIAALRAPSPAALDPVTVEALEKKLAAVKAALNAPDLWMARVQNALALLHDDNDRAKLIALKDEFNAEIDRALIGQAAPAGNAQEPWYPIETAPKDRFILLYCPEDNSRWFAKWQSGEWYGSDCEHGIRRTGHSFGDPNYVTGWFVTHWREVPLYATTASNCQEASWQPIETAPFHAEILLWWKHGGVAVGFWDDENEGWRCEADDCVPKNQSDCTHWMRLPASPVTSTDNTLKRRSEADAYFKILQTIAQFPISDPKNMDAINMRLIAEGAISLGPSSHMDGEKS